MKVCYEELSSVNWGPDVIGSETRDTNEAKRTSFAYWQLVDIQHL